MIVLQGVSERIDQLLFSPDGRALVAPSSKGLQVWRDLRPQPAIPWPAYIWSVRFTPDGHGLLVGSGTAGVLELATGKVVCQLPSGCRYFDISPDSRDLLITRSSQRLESRPVDRLDVATWAVGGVRSSLWPPMFLADGKRFLVFDCERGSTGWINFYVTRDAATGKAQSKTSRPVRHPFLWPAFSPDRQLIAAWRDKWIAVFRIGYLEDPPLEIRNDNRKQFTGVAFHPSGRFLAATSNDSTVKFYDTATWQMVHAFNWEIGRLRSITFSPDGTAAAAGGDKGQVVVWDVDL